MRGSLVQPRRTTRSRVAATICGTLPVLSILCGGCEAGFGARSAWNVLLVSVDTLRADHLGCYGYPLPTTPNIDSFARDAVRFDLAVAHAPSTLASHASIFTSMVPAQHGAFVATHSALRLDIRTLTEVLADQGFATVAFRGGGQLAEEFGLGQGFEVYETVPPPFSRAVSRAEAWLDQNPDRRFFMFLHTYEVHHPYEPEPRLLRIFEDSYTGSLPDHIEVEEHLKRINGLVDPPLAIGEADLQHIVSTYDAQIRSMDESFGRLIDSLKDRGLYDRTLIVFTSDHGEEFDEHGFVGWHGHTLFDELLRVPLLLKLPGSREAGRVVTGQVRGIDVAPTILEVLGVQTPDSFQGTSLLVEGETAAPPAGYVVSQRDVPAHVSPMLSVRTPRWKLYRGRLYDLANDPGEKTDVSDRHPQVVAELEAVEANVLAGGAESRQAAALISEETRTRLEELGYSD